MRLATGLRPDPLGELKRSQSPAVQGMGKERKGKGWYREGKGGVRGVREEEGEVGRNFPP